MVLPLLTERLTVRMMRSGDVARFVAYRNHPTIARFQDWTLPFTEEAGVRLIDDQAAVDGPTNGQWVQLAVDHDGALGGYGAPHDPGADSAVHRHHLARRDHPGLDVVHDR